MLAAPAENSMENTAFHVQTATGLHVDYDKGGNRSMTGNSNSAPPLVLAAAVANPTRLDAPTNLPNHDADELAN
uniref:Peptidase S8/S53 domain-containing protein n=1 Tax=Mycena chlorophos TaxID=658473 RepID=A0ABQ0L794_MYCCL|nr:predicted protein [Mycena chlorophos]